MKYNINYSKSEFCNQKLVFGLMKPDIVHFSMSCIYIVIYAILYESPLASSIDEDILQISSIEFTYLLSLSCNKKNDYKSLSIHSSLGILQG